MRATLKIWLAEPLVYFLLAGALIFGIWRWTEDATDPYRIEITPAERARIAAQWEAQMGRAPDESELNALIERFVREEIYYREALRLGLDAHDTIIRRRLAQKLGFLTEDIATAGEPTEQELRAYYSAHAERYEAPELFTFEHRYFSAERRNDAEAAARAAVAALNEGADTDSGDPFILQSVFRARSLREIGDLFGRQFAEGLEELSPGDWQGPLRSAYGWHAVRISERTAARQRPYSEVAARVSNDYAQSQRDAANTRYYETLKRRYQVVHH